jgi:enolase-phosphatase E1
MSMGVTYSNVACVLLDIEGTLANVQFVYDVMFPFAKKHMRSFLQREWQSPNTLTALQQVASDAGLEMDKWLGNKWESGGVSHIENADAHLQKLMDGDSKTTGLKSLQGMVWKEGFESGAMKAELFPDVLPALLAWKGQGLQLRVYSSGSEQAQRLFFGHTTQGSLLDLFSGFYDTNVGKKQDSESYSKIAKACALPPQEILFVSDVAEELLAAQSAEMQVLASIRPNNKPFAEAYVGPRVTSFSNMTIANVGRSFASDT